MFFQRPRLQICTGLGLISGLACAMAMSFGSWAWIIGGALCLSFWILGMVWSDLKGE